MGRETSYNEIFDAQSHFRLLLDGMARPGKLNTFPIIDIQPPAGVFNSTILVCFALLNGDVSFSVLDDPKEEISKYILLNTSSAPDDFRDANFVIMNGDSEGEVLFDMRIGTLSYPEDSGTIILQVERLSEVIMDDAEVIILKGPGVDGEKALYVKGLNKSFLKNLRAINMEFPLGIDVILTDKDNQVTGLPRTNRFEF
jgi:alpha-D-ribose 1-methylphosphonate 5-triphosphate synthase subunit PhnH